MAHSDSWQYPEAAQRTAQFLDWFQNSPLVRLSPKVILSHRRYLETGTDSQAGRSVVASADIEPDEELFAIPRDVVLTASASTIPQDIVAPLQDLGSWLPLIVAIIYEYLRGDPSPWYYYFRILPTSFDALMFWSDAELAELQASAVIDKIGRLSAEDSWKETIVPIMLQHPELFPVEGDTEAMKISELIKLAHFAGSLIMAYAFDIDRDEDTKKSDAASEDEDFEEDDEDEPLKGMVPMADMLNADADRNNARLFQEDDFLIMKATQPIKAGDEIFNDYGPLPRSELVRMYGYVTDNYAQYDVVDVSHELFVNVAGMTDPKRNTAWLKREEQLLELGIIDDGYSLHRPTSAAKLEDYLPGNIHMLLRGLCLDENSTRVPKLNYQESVSIEEASLLSLVATKRLSEYQTSLEEDRQVACSTSREYMALAIRKGEKEVLLSIIDMCQRHLKQKTEELAKPNKRKHDDDHHVSKARKTKGR